VDYHNALKCKPKGYRDVAGQNKRRNYNEDGISQE
jgi:hypothetical protein